MYSNVFVAFHDFLDSGKGELMVLEQFDVLGHLINFSLHLGELSLHVLEVALEVLGLLVAFVLIWMRHTLPFI